MGISLSSKQCVVLAGLLSGLLACDTLCAAVPAAEYDAAIQQARAGQTGPALQKLQTWHDADPKDQRIVFDLVAISDMAGLYEQAIPFLPQVLRADVPAYALKAAAHSARMSGRAQEAESGYRLLLAKTPDDMEAYAGLAYALMAQDRLQAAFDLLIARTPKWPEAATRIHAPVLVALGELHERRREWVAAADRYREVLKLDPGFRFVLRSRTFALNAAGMPYQAKRLADLQPEAFSEDEKHRLDHDAAARTISFGEAQIAVDGDRTRFATTDVALEENAEVLRRHGPVPATRFDRLVALKNRLKMQEVIELYQAMRKEGLALPVYAKFAVADAYLFLKQPEAARDLYLEGFREAGAMPVAEVLDWKISLIYAHVEAEQHDEAAAIADNLARETPNIINKGIPGLEGPNPAAPRIHHLRSLLYLYADRLAQAEQRLAESRAAAPFNFEIRSAWASLQSSRDHPRAALEEFTLLQVDEPKSASVALSRGETLLGLNRYTEAKAVLPPLQEQQPDSRAVQSFANKLAIYAMPMFRAETSIGRGASAVGGESVLDASLYSGPLSQSLGDPFRVFSHLARSQGHARDEPVERTRVGVGLDYRRGDVGAEAEVTHLTGSGRDTGKEGLALALSWDLSDAWHARASLDTNVTDLPAAAIRGGVTAQVARASLTWVENESRKAGGELSRQRFSDGNMRDSARIWWQERWISGPVLKLDTVLSLAASTNSADGRAYFNPVRDRELGLDIRGEWLTWRRYQRSFKQRIGLGIGEYWQAGYQAGLVGDVRYEHEWSRDDLVGVRYGIGHSFHPYDGNRDSRNYGYLSFYGRF